MAFACVVENSSSLQTTFGGETLNEMVRVTLHDPTIVEVSATATNRLAVETTKIASLVSRQRRKATEGVKTATSVGGSAGSAAKALNEKTKSAFTAVAKATDTAGWGEFWGA